MLYKCFVLPSCCAIRLADCVWWGVTMQCWQLMLAATACLGDLVVIMAMCVTCFTAARQVQLDVCLGHVCLLCSQARLATCNPCFADQTTTVTLLFGSLPALFQLYS